MGGCLGPLRNGRQRQARFPRHYQPALSIEHPVLQRSAAGRDGLRRSPALVRRAHESKRIHPVFSRYSARLGAVGPEPCRPRIDSPPERSKLGSPLHSRASVGPIARRAGASRAGVNEGVSRQPSGAARPDIDIHRAVWNQRQRGGSDAFGRLIR